MILKISKIQGVGGVSNSKKPQKTKCSKGSFFSTFACSALEGSQELEIDGMHFCKAHTSQGFSLQNLK